MEEGESRDKEEAREGQREKQREKKRRGGRGARVCDLVG